MEYVSSSALALWGYGASAVGFLVFATQLAARWRGGLRGSLLLAAIVLSACWAACAAGFSQTGSPLLAAGAVLFNTLRLCAWFAFLLSLLNANSAEKPGGDLRNLLAPRWAVVGIVVAALANVVLMGFSSSADYLGGRASQLPFAPPLALAVLGLVLLEQVIRNAPTTDRWGLKPMVLGLGASFCFDLYLFAEAFLFKRLDLNAWTVRGVVNLLTIPLLAMATTRTKAWNIRVTVSRHIVFHSTALLATGLYLLGIAGAGYYLRYFGGSWGGALQIVLLFAGLLFLAVVLTSGSYRSRLRVFVSKHFFSYQYDYREEWLRFTHSLSSGTPQAGGLPELVIKSLADLVESPAGALWLAEGGGGMRQNARLNMPRIAEVEPAASPLLDFLGRTQWILDVDELHASPEDYGFLRLPSWLESLEDAWLVIPMFFEQKLFGFVVLAHPRAKVDINWEVLDLLKTASSQAASYLTHMRAEDALLEAKKFDSFNRMSAFVVHDIKNLVAQLSLLLKNAERHKDNPEFQKDMFMTIAHAVDRMKQLLLQLRAGTTPIDRPRPVMLADIINRVHLAKLGQASNLEVGVEEGIEVLGHAERLERVVGHLVQNALEATPPEGRVWIRLSRDGDNAMVEVGDSGCGMSQEFIRNHLFRPFDSTKNAGMGIGAYESAQYVSELGGRLAVESEERQGTIIRIVLPLHHRLATAMELEQT
ncbi:MAG: PEP-CTERM system histidine kinase PrsK [Rhodocyclaceae bacterium]|nr:PEP-CTERM system histidine kinase PrsK [Rhodocyclaceae bacterium]